MRRIRLALALFMGLVSIPALAQRGAFTTVANGSISVTNTFQSVFAASPNGTSRAGCSIQNQGTHTMYVFFGAIANATLAKSYQISPGQAVYCNNNNDIILQDQVSITGTSGDAYAATSQ